MSRGQAWELTYTLVELRCCRILRGYRRGSLVGSSTGLAISWHWRISGFLMLSRGWGRAWS